MHGSANVHAPSNRRESEKKKLNKRRFFFDKSFMQFHCSRRWNSGSGWKFRFPSTPWGLIHLSHSHHTQIQPPLSTFFKKTFPYFYYEEVHRFACFLFALDCSNQRNYNCALHFPFPYSYRNYFYVSWISFTFPASRGCFLSQEERITLKRCSCSTWGSGDCLLMLKVERQERAEGKN